MSALIALPCVKAVGNAKHLDESGSLALFIGETAEDSASNSNGTTFVKGKKFYPWLDDGCGAAWNDVWITPGGTIVREGIIILRGSDMQSVDACRS